MKNLFKRLFYVVALIPYTQLLLVLGTFQISDCGNKWHFQFLRVPVQIYHDLRSVPVTFTFCLKSKMGEGMGDRGERCSGAR